MLKKIVMALVLVGGMVSNADARHHRHFHSGGQHFHHRMYVDPTPQRQAEYNHQDTGFNWLTNPFQAVQSAGVSAYNTVHPYMAWCGWWMREHIGKQIGRAIPAAYNLAANWAHFGRPASGPAPGVIAVKSHHVMQITKVLGPGRIVAISGNSGNRNVCGGQRHCVTEHERSTHGIIAYRWPS